MTSGIGLPYINIAVAESAVHARFFDVTCVNIAFASKDLRKLQLQVCANANIVRLANGLASLQERLAFLTPINTGRVEASSCSRKSADKLAANRSTKGTASASGTVRGTLINTFFRMGGLIYM